MLTRDLFAIANVPIQMAVNSRTYPQLYIIKGALNLCWQMCPNDNENNTLNITAILTSTAGFIVYSTIKLQLSRTVEMKMKITLRGDANTARWL